MNKFRRVPAELKEQILHRIRTEGISVSQASREHTVSTPTIYSWLSASAELPLSTLQINKLKRENEELKKLLGQAMLMSERSKKNQSHYAG
jgi:transposase-like protein